jgi:hypothetical protein
MRHLPFHNVAYSHDLSELTNFNKQGITIVTPDLKSDSTNPNPTLCMTAGCQMVAMRFQLINDTLLQNYIEYFDLAGYAFVLKPPKLLYVPVTIQDPSSQDQNLSYAPVQVQVAGGSTITA